MNTLLKKGVAYATLCLTVGLGACKKEEEPPAPMPNPPLSLKLAKTDATTFEGADGKVDLTVTGGLTPYTYAWSNGATTEDIDKLIAGTYRVTVTDKAGKTATDSVKIAQPEPIGFVSSAQAYQQLNLALKQFKGTDANAFEDNLITNYYVLTELQADNALSTGQQAGWKSFENHQLDATHPMVDAFWDKCLKVIRQANQVIEKTALTPADRIEPMEAVLITGYARMIRAYTYYVYTNVFYHVPLLLEAQPAASALSRKEEVTAQIIEDLSFAQVQIPAMPNVTLESNLTSLGAGALLARIYLEQREYGKALQQAETLIESGRFSLSSNYDALFNSADASDELIWALQYKPEEVKCTLPAYITTKGTAAYLEAKSDFYTAHSSGDTRRQTNVVQDNGKYYFNKYRTTGAWQLPLIRYAEILLIQAEAAAIMGDISQAASSLNAVRRRANLPVVDPADLQEMRQLILQERRMELALEGHRWFDLVRTGEINSVRPAFTPTRQVWPIPAQELNDNPNYFQNPGY